MRRSATPVPTVRNCGDASPILCTIARQGGVPLSHKPPTILQIIPELDTGGAELSAVEIAEALARAGARALVATQGGRLASRVQAAGAEIIPFPAATKNPLRMLANVRGLERLIREHNVDLLHARSRAPAWSALGAARRARIPFVTTYHGAYSENGRLKNLYNSVMARSDIVIANSGFTAGLLRDRYGTPEARIRVIHRGVDCDHFDPAAVSDDRAAAPRARWGIGPSARIVLVPARLTAWKGQRIVIDAAGILKAQGVQDDVCFVMAGDAQGRNDYLAALHARAEELDLTDRIFFVGHVADMATAYRTAWATVIASIEPEAFGRVAIETQAMAVPVIATDLGAPPETILTQPSAATDRVTGWLVPAGDAAVLAAQLAAILAMPPTDHAAIGRRARAHVLKHFTLRAMKEQTLAVYDQLLTADLRSRFMSALPVT
jgi:glycosyltransferase involved in cell wall biosynthesis